MRVDFKTGTFYQGDCFEVMADLVPGSVDMVLNDPPYGTVKGAGLDGWKNGNTDWDVAFEPSVIYEAYNRVLRVNASCILFSQEPYTSRLIQSAHKDLPFSYRMIWKKDHFANALIAKKAPVSYYEDICVFNKTWDHLLLHPLRWYAQGILQLLGGNLKDVNSRLGHRRAEHFFYWDSSQFSLPSESTYLEIKNLCGSPPHWIPYVDLVQQDAAFSKVFNLPPGRKYLSNVLEFKKDYEGLHPTQKPVALFEYLIRTYTNPDELVLDNTAGSGTTAIAAIQSGRRWICIERDEGYFAKAIARVWDAEASL